LCVSTAASLAVAGVMEERLESARLRLLDLYGLDDAHA